MKFFIFVVLFYVALAAMTFGKLPYTFFQQDEWAIFGHLMNADKSGISLLDRLTIYEQDTHLVPFTNALTLLEYRLFGINFAPYAITAIAFHLGNAVLVYELASLLLKKKWLAVAAGAIFLINSISHQAVTWTATATGTVTSTTVTLISLIFFSKYLVTGERNRLYVWFSILIFFLSLFFKETSIFVFFFYPIFWFILSKKRNFKRAVQIIFPLGTLGIVYVLVRIVFSWLVAPGIASELYQPPFVVYFFRMIALPIRVIAQSFVPVSFILKTARLFVPLAYPHFVTVGTPDPYIVESAAADIISFFIFCFLLLSQSIGRLTRVSLLFIALSALPFVVVPGIAGYLSLIDGRHLYLTGIFSAIFLSLVIGHVFIGARKHRVVYTVIVIIVGLFGIYHILKIRKDTDYQVALAHVRMPILEKITRSYPVLPTRVVFYITSDTPYYGLPYEEPILPFQSGFGQTLLVWYEARGENFPACFFAKKYLYELLSEGYKECDGRGFGYFRKSDTFEQAIQQFAIAPEQIIAFDYASGTNALTDVTEHLRRVLQ